MLGDFSSTHLELALNVAPEAEDTRIMSGMSEDIHTLFTKTNITTNWHHYGVSPANFTKFVAPKGMPLLYGFVL